MRWLLLVVALSSCANTRGRLPSSPSSADLANDGSPAQQQALKEHYEAHKVGGLSEVNPEGVLVGTARRPLQLLQMTPPDVRAYLESMPEARGVLMSPLVEGLASFGWVALAGLSLLLVPLAAATVGLFAVTIEENPLVEEDARFGLRLASVLGMMVVGALVLPLIAYGVVDFLLIQPAIERHREEAIQKFNAAVDKRITENAGAPE